jgi:hypothetical protein
MESRFKLCFGRAFCILSFAIGLAPAIAIAQDDEKIPRSNDSVREFSLGAASNYEIRSKGSLLELNRVPVLGWTNPVRKSKHGSVFVWTNDGRPEVIACIYLDTKTGWRHEFKSITTSESVQTSEASKEIWSTVEPGIEWKTIEDVESVSNSESQRLIQLRHIARTFSGSVDSAGVEEDLRLLSTPLYRYNSSDAGVIDGAIFCLAQGTNPEILILIEAVESKSKPWRFALARMTGYACQAKRNGISIWKVDHRAIGGAGSTTYYNRVIGEVPGSPD